MNNLSRQVLILIRGGLGSGKTTVGKLLRDSLSPAISISFNIFHTFISQDPIKNKSLTFEAMLMITDFFLKKKFSVILNELFIYPESIYPFLKLGEKYQIPVFLFELQVSEEEAFKRYELEGIKKVPRENIRKVLELLSTHPIPSAYEIDTNQYSAEEVKNLILKAIYERFSEND